MEMNYGRLLQIIFTGLIPVVMSACIFQDGSENNSEQNYPSLAYLYVDVQIEEDLIVVSSPSYSVNSDIFSPPSLIDDGYSSKNYENSFPYNACLSYDDWSAPSACDGTYNFTQGYSGGTTVTIKSAIGQGISVFSQFTAQALIPLNSPLPDETYSVRDDSLIINWDNYMGLEAEAVKLSPCLADDRDFMLITLTPEEQQLRSAEVLLDDYDQTCQYPEYLDVSVYYPTEGEIDDQLAGGRFRVRIYTQPSRVNLTD